jgi:hypothetical protein
VEGTRSAAGAACFAFVALAATRRLTLVAIGLAFGRGHEIIRDPLYQTSTGSKKGDRGASVLAPAHHLNDAVLGALVGGDDG